MTSIQDLPNELIICIFEDLPSIRDVVHLAMTCNTFIDIWYDNADRIGEPALQRGYTKEAYDLAKMQTKKQTQRSYNILYYLRAIVQAIERHDAIVKDLLALRRWDYESKSSKKAISLTRTSYYLAAQLSLAYERPKLKPQVLENLTPHQPLMDYHLGFWTWAGNSLGSPYYAMFCKMQEYHLGDFTKSLKPPDKWMAVRNGLKGGPTGWSDR